MKSRAAVLRREVLQLEKAKRGLKDVWVARGVLLREKRVRSRLLPCIAFQRRLHSSLNTQCIV